MNFPSTLFTLAAFLYVAPQVAGNDQAGATPVLFEIPNGGTLTCVDPGSRCVRGSGGGDGARFQPPARRP